MDRERFLRSHASITRRYFLGCGAAGVIALRDRSLSAAEGAPDERLQQAIDRLETWLTSQG